MTYQYNRIGFQDLNVTNPYTYKITENKDGSISLSERFGDVIVEGTPLNSENLNHLEDGIYNATEGLNVLETKIDNLEETFESTSVTHKKDTIVGSVSRPVYVTETGAVALCAPIPSVVGEVVSGSEACLTSGAAYSALSLKADKDIPILTLPGTGTSELVSGNIYRCVLKGAKEFILPEITDHSKLHQIKVQIHMENVVSINVGTLYFFDKKAPDLSEPGSYTLFYEHDGINWICGSFSKGLAQ